MVLDIEEALVWARYGVYADTKMRQATTEPDYTDTGELPLAFSEWYTEEQRLAGEQDELF